MNHSESFARDKQNSLEDDVLVNWHEKKRELYTREILLLFIFTQKFEYAADYRLKLQLFNLKHS